MRSWHAVGQCRVVSTSRRGTPPRDGVVVRRATTSDAPEVAEVHVASWRRGYSGLIPEDYLARLRASDRVEEWQRMLQLDDERFRVFVAERDGRIVGLGATTTTGDAERVGEIAQLYVHPDVWGSGVADQLLHELEADLRARGCGAALLEVAAGNVRATRFYERHGWRNANVDGEQELWGVVVRTATYRKAL